MQINVWHRIEINQTSKITWNIKEEKFIEIDGLQ